MEIRYAPLSEIALDPLNPRLGRDAHKEGLDQDDVASLMSDWSLEELATSFLENGFWAHEAVICIEPDVDVDENLLVIEGNRRIAALKRLQAAFAGEERSKKWRTLVEDEEEPAHLFDSVPYILVANRDEVDDFLGFRHVTGIKEWAPAEKAQFITKLIEKYDLSYRDVMRKIGSKTPTVQRNYISYCLFTEMERVESIDISYVEEKFSVLFLALRERGVQQFLDIEDKFEVEPSEVRPIIGAANETAVVDFTRWLFGNDQFEPVVTDSRYVNRFARVLMSEEGLAYLRSVKRPSLEKAFVIAGGDQEEFLDLISVAAYNVEESLSSAHHFASDSAAKKIVDRLTVNVEQLGKIFSGR